MREFKIRASKAGEILTNPRAKTETLSATTKTMVKTWLKETLYKRKSFKGNKYTDKGNYNEEEGVTLLALKFGVWLDTNTTYQENEYMCGTCDINHAEKGIWDIKNSYSLDTFPMFETELPNKEYADQVNVYQHLYNNHKGGVAYVLTDLPDELLEKELKWLQSDNEKQERALGFIYSVENWQRVKEKYFSSADDIEFVEIPQDKRVKCFDVEYDAEKIKKIEERVVEIRKYIKELVN